MFLKFLILKLCLHRGNLFRESHFLRHIILLLMEFLVVVRDVPIHIELLLRVSFRLAEDAPDSVTDALASAPLARGAGGREETGGPRDLLGGGGDVLRGFR